MTDAAALDSLYAASIVATVREPLLLLDDDLRVVMTNASFCRAFGSTRDEVEGSFLHELDGGAWDKPDLRRQLQDVLPCDLEMSGFEVVLDPPAGRTLLLNARRLTPRDGGAPLILLAFEDVTESRRLQRALESTMSELQRSNEELESFATIASHDLQEPLRKIIAFGERLDHTCRDLLPEKGRDYLARMTGAAGRMQRLINDLLMLSRVSTRGAGFSEVDLESVVSDVLGDLEETLARAGGRVECDPLPRIAADPTQMRQLFQNLIGNGLEFRNERAPVVRITARRGSSELAGWFDTVPVWRFEVADNGIGFDQKHADRIFRPFERLHPRETFEGTGIGLALCQRIVRRHGGTIRAEGQPGVGARIIIHLPSRQKEVS